MTAVPPDSTAAAADDRLYNAELGSQHILYTADFRASRSAGGSGASAAKRNSDSQDAGDSDSGFPEEQEQINEMPILRKR